MTELALRGDAPVAFTGTVSRIQSAANDMAAAAHIAKALVSTSFVPQHFRGKAEDAAAAIMYGDTIGMDPLTALQNIHVISGKPGLYARAMVAVVLSHGHRIWTEEAGPQKVVVCGQRKGTDKVERSEWTYERARKAGYTSNKKYDTDGEAMLYARASGDVARRIAPDALLGMAYTIEELELEDESATETTAPRSSVSRLRAAVAAPQSIEAVPEPVADEPQAETSEPPAAAVEDMLPVVDDVPPVDPPDPGSEPAAPVQLAQIKALLMGFGVRGQNQQTAKLARITGRELTGPGDLTKADAAAIIGTLEDIGARPDASAEFAAEFGDQA